MASEAEQMGQFVHQHKRMAMGAKIDGATMGAKDGGHTPAKHHSKPKKHPEGGLAHMKKK